MPATSGSENDSCQKKVALLRVVLTTRTFCRALTSALALAGRRQAGRLLGLRHGRHVGERLLAEALGHRVVLLVQSAHGPERRPFLVAESGLSGRRSFARCDALGGWRVRRPDAELGGPIGGLGFLEISE